MAPEREPSSPAKHSLWPLALLGILAAASWFRSRSYTPKKQPIEPAQTQESRAGNSGIGQNKNDNAAPSIVTHQIAPPDSEDEDTQKRRKKLDKLRKAGVAWLSLGTFIVVLWYTLIAKNQWEAMEGALEQARKQTRLGQQHFEQTDRAWVGLENKHMSSFTVTISKSTVKLSARYKIENFGLSSESNL